MQKHNNNWLKIISSSFYYLFLFRARNRLDEDEDSNTRGVWGVRGVIGVM